MPDYTASQAAAAMAQQGSLSQQAASKLGQRDRSIAVSSIARGFEDPVMSCFVIDASPSMEPYRDAVIEGQRAMIDALRGSSKCRRGGLQLAQWLFSSGVSLLNPFTVLNPAGSDGVKLLDAASYRPEDGNRTALYQTVLQVLQEMAAMHAYARTQGIRTTFSIGVITDGENNVPGVSPADIKCIVKELTANGVLARSTMIGVEGPELSREKILALKDDLGFQEAIFVGQSAQEIRRAFLLASQSAIQAQR